jgi:hypothetical protein
MSEETNDSTATQSNDDTVDANTEETAAEAGLPGGTTEEPSTEETSEEAPAGAPEEYGDFDISAGKEINYQLSDEQKAAFGELAKSLNLTQEQAQSLVAFDIAKNQQSIASQEAFAKSYQDDGLAAQRKEYGEKYDEQHAKNDKVFKKFFDEPTRAFLNDSGISSQLGFANGLKAMAAALSEDTTVPPDGNNKKNESLSSMFSDLNKTT